MRRAGLGVLAVVLLIASGCSSDGGTAGPVDGEGTAATDQDISATTDPVGAFCTAWIDISDLADELDQDLRADGVEELFEAIESVGRVPAEIRTEWEIWVDTATRFRDLFATVGYRPDRVTDELVAQAFGSVEAAEASEQAADEAELAIDRWTITGCGDFCARWPQLQQALDETVDGLWWVLDDPENGPARLEQHLRSFEIGTALAPDAIRDELDDAIASRTDWIEWWESLGFDVAQLSSSPSGRDAAIERIANAAYLTDDGSEEMQLIRRLQAGERLGPGELDAVFGYWYFDGRHPGQEIVEWVEVNCDEATGEPGQIHVRFPLVEGAAGDTFVAAVLPRGFSVEDLSAPERFLAGMCQPVDQDPWGRWYDEEGSEERWESEGLRVERWRDDSLCDYRWEEPPVRLDAGAYTLVAAVIEGGRGDPSVAPELELCLALDVDIDGNTVVDLPPLPRCEVDLTSGEPDPWRNREPVDPSTPGAGTLRIVVPSMVVPDDIALEHGGHLTIIVLPAGTTLNEVGREQVWPAGGIRTWLTQPGTEHGFEMARRGEVEVPVAEVPASGGVRELSPEWLLEDPPDDRVPLTLLAPGVYDVRVQVTAQSDEHEQSMCATFEVTIAGDTLAELPDLGECPEQL